MRTLREYAAEQLDAFAQELVDESTIPTIVVGTPSERLDAIERWERMLVASGQVPDDIVETMPEVSRHNEPQIGPQEYECGCTTMVYVTDRDVYRHEKPFEMRLAFSCDGTSCTRGGSSS